MTSAGELIPTRCPICGTAGNADELYPANFDFGAFNPAVFSARRLPDRVHYRMVKCCDCGLVRSDPIASKELLAQLYKLSTFTYCDEVSDLRHTYGRYLARLEDFGVRKDAILEIGCGNGFFLEEAKTRGYKMVRGVEPSQAAVEQAPKELKPKIVCGLMAPGLFDAGQFDVICMFQVFDHVPDPSGLLLECLRVLKPGGLFLSINHNVESFSARILKDHSPIVDIEHTCLYSPSTMRRIFSSHGFNVLNVGPVFNRNTLYYLCRLLPLPAAIKRPLLAWMQRCSLGRWRVSVPLGNLFLVAKKPEVMDDGSRSDGLGKSGFYS